MADKLRAALHGARFLPAAAIPEGAVVEVVEVCPETGDPMTTRARIDRVHNADPVPGRIRWETPMGDLHVGGAQRVEVKSLP